MTMYREILRLRDEGKVSQRDIAASCGCAHSTVKRVLARSRMHIPLKINTLTVSD